MTQRKNSVSFKEILDFHEQTLGKSDTEKQIIAESLSIDFNEYKRRIFGKEKEMEFLIFMKSVASIRDIKVIDEELSQISGDKTPDFEVVFIDNYKMMIEVKHTDKDEYKISGGNLQKRIDYATAHNMPLRFAISIKGFWGLFTSDFIISNNGKISLSDYFGETRNSLLDRELETCSYMFMQQLKIISVYSNNTREGLGVFFEPYGELISYELYCSNNLIFKVDKNNLSKMLHIFVLEAVQDCLSNIHQDIIQNDEDTTKIIEYNNDSECRNFAEYFLVMASIRHMIYKNKNSRDNIFITANDSNNNFLLVEHIRLVMSDLFDLGVEIICFKDGCGYKFDDYREKFWVKKRDEVRK